ncbi:adenylate/guanylate cyclase domain-containing protein [Mucilaginibacter sp. BJC16-A38]|uniref:adenylate/guanylate cyclase domain-containing protein n=1 Tax=Mucilaginibacter phenanthrenivorans TaxID=1234842 RepID=UPI002158026F|nr:adenylate/guanylate cyclase domain-containing protein [Mucilaginibacter phenanthrenivorans]MCR8557305.1 adenylate/guanylate cyclase domain-containing protein [Mucilaginibacter phenanthrenivorans]
MKYINDRPQYLQSGVDTGTLSLADLIQDDCSAGRRGLLCPEANAAAASGQAEQTVMEKELAIFFLDIRNFTGFLQSGSQLENVQTVKKLLDLFVKIIDNFGGRVVDRAGDSLYAVYGLETNPETAANDALQSARMIYEALDFVNREYVMAKFGFPLQAGVGLNAGGVVVEYAHSPEMPLSVMGLPVNVAARLQEQTKHQNNDLILSDAFYSLLSDDHKKSLNHERRHLKVAGVQTLQTVWLAGKSYARNLSHHTMEMDYFMAIAG